jgi:hypothetical protein
MQPIGYATHITAVISQQPKPKERMMTTTTQIYRGVEINVTKHDDVFDFGTGPSWSYEIAGHDRPMWSSNISEADAIEQAKKTIDKMLAAEVRISEGDQFVLGINLAEVSQQNEFIRKLVAAAQESSNGTAEMQDAEGCLVTAVISN